MDLQIHLERTADSSDGAQFERLNDSDPYVSTVMTYMCTHVGRTCFMTATVMGIYRKKNMFGFITRVSSREILHFFPNILT